MTIPNPDDVHVYPLNDLREHITDGPGCPCNPRVEVVGANLLYVHHAWDMREVTEDPEGLAEEIRKEANA